MYRFLQLLSGIVLFVSASALHAQTPPPDLLDPPPGSTCPAPTAPSEPGNVHMFPGRWWNPQRNGTGWDFFYNDGQQKMYLTWFTFDRNGNPIWLHGAAEDLQFNAVTGERTWQSRLYVARWTFSTSGRILRRAGSVSVTFPNQTSTRAAVRWRWERSSPDGSQTGIEPVGPLTYDECIFDTFRDQRQRIPEVVSVNQAFSANWFYRSVEDHPLVGWGVDLLIDLHPVTQQYAETATTAIFDVNGRPAWLQSRDLWGANPPPGDTLNVTGVGKLNYYRYTIGTPGLHPAVTVCETPSSTCGPKAHDGSDPDQDPDTYGSFLRRIDDATNGRIRLTAQVPQTVTGIGEIDWPPPAAVQDPDLPAEVPVMRFDANHVIVDKSVCRVPTEYSTCTFTVSWSSNDPNAEIYKIDLNTGATSPQPFATGLSNIALDELPLGARIQYQLRYRYNGNGPSTSLRTPEVRVLLANAIADANVENIACTPSGNNGCDLALHEPTAGAVAGEASTDGGSAGYSVPIAVPPGRNGVQPQLALSYSSRSGNGIGGRGWSLSGTSSIHRCPRTVAQDGVGNARAVGMSVHDALCLDGERLVVVGVDGKPASGTNYGVSGAYYRTEINNFARVRQYGGDLASAATCFKVEFKTGEVAYYGGIAESNSCSGGGSRQLLRGAPAEIPLSWQIERSEDASGNSIAYSYAEAGKSELLLQAIHYTGKGASPGNRSVWFSYLDRPASDRSRAHFIGGEIERTQLLKRITTKVGTTEIGSYRLLYSATHDDDRVDPSLHDGSSTVKRIRQCGRGGTGNNGAEVCLPDTHVTWNDLPPDHVLRPLTVSGLPEPAPVNGTFIDRRIHPIGDVDGDGVREVLVYQYEADAAWHTWLVKQNADRAVQGRLDISALAGQSAYFTRGMQTDFDGDGRSDFIGSNGTTLSLHRWALGRGVNFGASVATSFSTTSLGNVPAAGLVGTDDLNGDGLPDLLLQRNGGCQVSDQEEELPGGGVVVLNQSLCFYRNTTATAGAFSFANGVSLYEWQHANYDGGLSGVGDLNGDGIGDFVVQTATAQPGGVVNAIETVIVSLMPGVAMPKNDCELTTSGSPFYACIPEGMGLPIDDTGYRTTDAVMRWHDVNGDGLVDLLYALPGTCSNMGHTCTRGTWYVQTSSGRRFNDEVLIGGNTDALLMTTGMETNRLRYVDKLPAIDVDTDGSTDLLYPVGLAARHCTVTDVSYTVEEPGTCAAYDHNPGTGGRSPLQEPCSARVWMCGNDPAVDLGTGAGYQLPYHGDLPGTTLTTDNIYTPRAHNAAFAATDLSLYYMAGLRFVATENGYEAQSFSLDSSAGPDRAGHRVTMTLSGPTSLNSGDDLYGDGLADPVTRAGCHTHGINATTCRYVGNGTTGPASFATRPTPGGAAVSVNVTDLNTGIRTLVNENIGVAEHVGRSPDLPGLVESITNGLGDAAFWTYVPLSSKASRTSGQLPLYLIPADGYTDASHFYFQSTMPVVSTMLRSSGTGGELGARSWRYGYAEAMYNRLGRGFQGFRAILREQLLPQSENARALRELTLFHQKFPLTGKVEFSRSGVALPALFSPETYAEFIYPFHDERYYWACHLTNRSACNTAGAPGITSFDYPFVNRQMSTTYDPASAELGQFARVTQTDLRNYDVDAPGVVSGWDDYGNLTASATKSADIAEAPGSLAFVINKETRQKARYDKFTTADLWWPGKLKDTDATILPVQYDNAHKLPQDVVLNGDTLHTQYKWNDDRTPQSVEVEPGNTPLRTFKQFFYPDPPHNHGLPVQTSDTYYDPLKSQNVTRTTQTVYSGDGYFVARTTDAAGVATDLEYRERDGQISRTQLATGVITYHYYDAFNRQMRTDAYKLDGANELPLTQSIHTAWNRCVGALCAGVGGGGIKFAGGPPTEQHAAYRVTTVQNGSPTKVAWFDMLGREVKAAARGFDGKFIATFNDYDTMGQLAQKSVPFLLSSGSATAPFVSTYAYDRAGRVSSKTGPDAASDVGENSLASEYVLSTYTYSGNYTHVQLSNSRGLSGCVPENVCVSIKRYSGVAGLMRTEDALGGVTRYWADAAGRPAAIADARTNALPANQITAARVTHATYNKLGQRINASDPNQGSWTFAYTGAGDLVRQTDARGTVTEITRDSAGRPTQQRSYLPAVGTQGQEFYLDEWNYEGGTSLLTAMRRCITGSLLQNCLDNGTDHSVWNESYTYDYGRMKTATASQRLLNNTRRNDTTTFYYDANHGREKAIGYQSGLRVQRVFTRFGALRDVLDADTGERFWGVGGMDAFGNVTHQNYGNGVVGEYTYDPVSGRPTSRQWVKEQQGHKFVVDRVEYGYDTLANLSEQHRSGISLDATERYTYDKLQRLRTSGTDSPAVTHQYKYDALGNLTRKDDYSRAIDNAYLYEPGTTLCGPNVATTILLPTDDSFDRVANTCDANGNITKSELRTESSVHTNPRVIRFDATNRPRYIYDGTAPGAPSALFTYAPDGRRVYQVSSETYVPTGTGAGAQRTRFIVMGQRGYQAELVSESGSTQETQRHEIGDVSVTLKPAPGGTGLKRQIAYKTFDRLGSPLGLLDESGNFRQRDENDVPTGTTQLTFSPFGSAREANFQVRAPANQMPGRINLLPGTRQGFTGHEHLDSLGLIHMNGRVYDHRLGRFLSVDPFIQFPANSQSLNPYSYIMNNPMAGVDPSGYVVRSRKRLPPMDESCMGDVSCEFNQTFSGPVESLRNGLNAGSRRSTNGYERETTQLKRAETPAQIFGLSKQDSDPVALNSTVDDAIERLREGFEKYQREYETYAEGVIRRVEVTGDEKHQEKVKEALQKLKLHPGAIKAVDTAAKRWGGLTIEATGNDVEYSETKEGKIEIGTGEGNVFIKVTIPLGDDPEPFYQRGHAIGGALYEVLTVTRAVLHEILHSAYDDFGAKSFVVNNSDDKLIIPMENSLIPAITGSRNLRLGHSDNVLREQLDPPEKTP